jgi:hypothetical protein
MVLYNARVLHYIPELFFLSLALSVYCCSLVQLKVVDTGALQWSKPAVVTLAREGANVSGVEVCLLVMLSKRKQVLLSLQSCERFKIPSNVRVTCRNPFALKLGLV